MLVLSRLRDESIIIGDNIVVTVIDIRGDKVRLGFEAPKEIPIHRQEVYDVIQRERKAEEERSKLENTVGGGNSVVPDAPNYNLQRLSSSSSLDYNPLIGFEGINGELTKLFKKEFRQYID